LRQVIIVPYDPTWAVEELTSALGEHLIPLHHIEEPC
jgi:hypothetical protein